MHVGMLKMQRKNGGWHSNKGDPQLVALGIDLVFIII
jgi:hypothetical protein